MNAVQTGNDERKQSSSTGVDVLRAGAVRCTRVKTTMMSLAENGKKSPFNFLKRSIRLQHGWLAGWLAAWLPGWLCADNYLLHTFEFISHVRNIYHLTWHTHTHTHTCDAEHGKQIEEKCRERTECAQEKTPKRISKMMKRAERYTYLSGLDEWMDGCLIKLPRNHMLSQSIMMRLRSCELCECMRGRCSRASNGQMGDRAKGERIYVLFTIERTWKANAT